MRRSAALGLIVLTRVTACALQKDENAQPVGRSVK